MIAIRYFCALWVAIWRVNNYFLVGIARDSIPSRRDEGQAPQSSRLDKNPPSCIISPLLHTTSYSFIPRVIRGNPKVLVLSLYGNVVHHEAPPNHHHDVSCISLLPCPSVILPRAISKFLPCHFERIRRRLRTQNSIICDCERR